VSGGILLPTLSDSILKMCILSTSWKDPACIFRTELGVTCVPTLVQWGTSKRLLDDQFGDVEVVKMLFEG